MIFGQHLFLIWEIKKNPRCMCLKKNKKLQFFPLLAKNIAICPYIAKNTALCT